MADFNELWDADNPSDSTEANQIDDYENNLRAMIAERIQDMVYGFTSGEDTDAPGFKYLTMKQQTSDPTTLADHVSIYVKDDSGACTYARPESAGTAVKILDASCQIPAGAYAADSIDEDDIRLSNNANLTARNAANDGDVNLIKANASDAVEIPDGATLASDAAPTADALIANKKYVDDHAIEQIVNTITGAVNTGTTQMPFDDTIPQITEGDEYMTLAITPKATTNLLKIDVVFNFAHSLSNDKVVTVALFQDTTANAIAAASMRGDETANYIDQIVFTHYMEAGTTDETTFKVRAGINSAGTTTFNGEGGSRVLGGVLASSITIMEIHP